MLLDANELEDERIRWSAIITDNCSTCGGRGYTVAQDDDGGLLSHVCRCKLEVDRNVRLVDWGVPRKFMGDQWSLDLLKGKSYLETIVNYVDNFDENYVNGRGLLLTGPHGRGKSMISSIVAKLVAVKHNKTGRPNNGQPPFYRVAFIIFNDAVALQLDKDPAAQRKLSTILYKTDLLVVDNVGNEVGKNENRFSQRMLEMILRKRDNDCLPTIISSNYSLEELAHEYNEDVHDFLVQNNDVIYVTGDNHRVGKVKEEFI